MMTTEKAISIVADGAAANARSMSQAIKDVIAKAIAWRPASWEDRKTRRLYYQGNGAPFIAKKLLEMFPESNVPVLPYDFAKHQAATSATFYDLQPERTLIDLKTKKKLEKDDPRVQAFAELQEQTMSAVVLPELERRAEGDLEHVCAVRVRETLDAEGNVKKVVRFELHWIENTYVLPDPMAPTDEQRAIAFGLDVRWGEKAEKAVELWSRDATSNKWTSSIETPDGKVMQPAEQQEGKFLPFVIARTEQPDGSPYVERGSADITIIEMNMVDVSDAAHTERMQGHTDRVYRGTRKEANELGGGTERNIVIDPGEELTTLDYNPKINERRESMQWRQKLLAMTTRSSQDSFAVDPQVPESGIARQIKNAPADKKADEHEPLYRVMEEQRLWPIAIETWNLFVEPGRKIEGVRVSVKPRRRQQYEDPEAKQRRAQADLDAGVISLAAYAVEVGRFNSIDDAVEAGLSNELAAAKKPDDPNAPKLSKFQLRLAAGQQPPKIERRDDVNEDNNTNEEDDNDQT